jgi:hypothetical protein
MRRVIVTARHWSNGQLETLRGYRVRNNNQLKHLRRHLSKVLASRNCEIVSIEFE